ncbi:MAG: hypothetical protein H7X93_05915, partial [Sphingomonadaceae bacterium]|nr:hypothetical protein [Sphingomonadaceae bacterium]
GGANAGEAYVIFGKAPAAAVNRTGAAGGQVIRGGAFDDTLSGVGGDDTLDGGGGADRLKGGKGKDSFVLDSVSPADADKIADFDAVKDLIALEGDAFGLPEGALAANRYVVGNAAEDANDRLIYNAANGKIFFDADGTGAQAQVLIATLTGAPNLAAADIVVI